MELVLTLKLFRCSLAQARALISTAPYNGGGSPSLSAALREMRVSQFRTNNGDRIGIQNIAIIVTNSFDNEASVASEAQLAMQDGIVLLAVGISQRLSVSQLALIASPPWGNVQSYFPTPLNNDLTINRQIISYRTCLAASQSQCQGKVSWIDILCHFFL